MFKTLGFHFIVRFDNLYMQLTICLANKLDLFCFKVGLFSSAMVHGLENESKVAKT